MKDTPDETYEDRQRKRDYEEITRRIYEKGKKATWKGDVKRLLLCCAITSIYFVAGTALTGDPTPPATALVVGLIAGCIAFLMLKAGAWVRVRAYGV